MNIGSQYDLLEDGNIQIDPSMAGSLKETAKWAKFVSIAGFVFSGFIFIFAIYYYNLMMKLDPLENYTNNGSYLIPIVLYVAIAIIWIVTAIYQFRFASKMLIALETNDQNAAQQSFSGLKVYYRISGMVTIISLLFSFLGIMSIVLNGGFPS